MHFSYWIQQLLILALKIEKPRKDFNELVAHHFVTLWLIGLVLSNILKKVEYRLTCLQLELRYKSDLNWKCRLR